MQRTFAQNLGLDRDPLESRIPRLFHLTFNTVATGGGGPFLLRLNPGQATGTLHNIIDATRTEDSRIKLLRLDPNIDS